MDFLHTKQRSWIFCTQNNAHGFYAHNAKYRPYLNLPLTINHSIFYVCSHQGDIRQKQTKTNKQIIIIYPNFPTELGIWHLNLPLTWTVSTLCLFHCANNQNQTPAGWSNQGWGVSQPGSDPACRPLAGQPHWMVSPSTWQGNPTECPVPQIRRSAQPPIHPPTSRGCVLTKSVRWCRWAYSRTPAAASDCWSLLLMLWIKHTQHCQSHS